MNEFNLRSFALYLLFRDLNFVLKIWIYLFYNHGLVTSNQAYGYQQ